MRAKLVGLLGLIAFAGMTGTTAHGQELLLGYLPSLAGPFATLSRTNELAAQIAVDEINAAGGVNGKKLKIISFDTAGKPDQAGRRLRKLAEDDKVLAVIGPFSSGECRGVLLAQRGHHDVDGVAAPKRRATCAPSSDEGYMFGKVMKTLQDKKYSIATGAAIAYATDDVIKDNG